MATTETQLRQYLEQHMGESFEIDGNPVGMIMQVGNDVGVQLFNPIVSGQTTYSAITPKVILHLLNDPNVNWGQVDVGAPPLGGDTGGGGNLPVWDIPYNIFPPASEPNYVSSPYNLGGGTTGGNAWYDQTDWTLPEGYGQPSAAEQDYYTAMAERNRTLNYLDGLQYELDFAMQQRAMALQEGNSQWAQQMDQYTYELQQSMFQWQQQLDSFDQQLQSASLQLQQQTAQGQLGLGYAGLGLDQSLAQNQFGLNAAQLAQQQYEFAQGLQQSPVDWIQGWQATRGMPFDVGGQSFQAPQIPQWQNYDIAQGSGQNMLPIPTPGGGQNMPPIPTPGGGQNVNIPTWPQQPVDIPQAPMPGDVPGSLQSTLPPPLLQDYQTKLMDAYEAQYNASVAQTQGTPLEGLFRSFGEGGYSANGQPLGIYSSPEAAARVMAELGFLPVSVQQAVGAYYGHYSPGGSGMPGRWMIPPPSQYAQPGTEAATIQGQLNQAYWMPQSTAIQDIMSGTRPNWMFIPGESSRVIQEPGHLDAASQQWHASSPVVRGAMPLANWVGNPMLLPGIVSQIPASQSAVPGSVGAYGGISPASFSPGTGVIPGVL